MGLFTTSKVYLGIDIGSSGTKIVELKKENESVRLTNYAFSENLDSKISGDWQVVEIESVAGNIKKIIDKAKISSKLVVAALPAYSVFSSIINLSNINKKDLEAAIKIEAKKVIPLPLEEMILDSQIIEDGAKNTNNVSVLLTGAPRTLVDKYLEIFKKANLQLLSLETETFSLIRSLMGNDKSSVMIVEIGTSTTDISIINKNIPILNRSIDVGGHTITSAISKSLNIGLERAEQFKYDLGISSIESQGDIIPKTIIETISPIINEIKYLINVFQTKNNEQIDKIILSGGSSLLPNLVNYLTKVMDIKVIVGDPWARISYPVDLKPVLDEIGPRMSVAIGLAMREMDN